MAKKDSGKRTTKRSSRGKRSRPASGGGVLINTGADKRFVRPVGGGEFVETGNASKSVHSANSLTSPPSGPGGRAQGKGVPKAGTPRTTSYVRTDDAGVLRVGVGDVPIDSVVAAFHAGHSPEMIRAQYPSLILEEVYGAIAYYLAHREQVDAYLKRQDALWDQWRTRSNAAKAPVVQRLGSRARTPATAPRDGR